MKNSREVRHAPRIRGLDGLRAIAVALVLIMHKTEFGTSSRIGFYGVWLFFLLSGYLITGQLYAARRRAEEGHSKPFSELLTFWYRRAFRIFPAYYVVLIAISCYYLLSGRELHGTLYYAFHLANVYLSNNMDQFHTTWAHFWSLAVEEQFYFLFAPLLILTPARHAIKLCIGVLVASAVQRIILTSEDMEPFRIYIDSLVNFGLLAAGGLLYLVSGRISALMERTRLNGGTAGWVALSIYFCLAASTTPLLADNPAALQTSYAIGCGVGLFVLANVISGQANSLVNLLEVPAISLLGRLSYSIYLINDYVPSDIPQRALAHASRRGADIAGELSTGHPYLSGLLSVAGILLCFAIVIGAAGLSWTLVERPALVLRDRLSGRLRFVWPSIKPVGAGSPVGVISDR
jgi:peptidoglycan/LPS O-acetylase OafA/YrhL